MKLSQLKFLLAAAKREIQAQWGNDEGVYYTNILIEQVQEMVNQIGPDGYKLMLEGETDASKDKI